MNMQQTQPTPQKKVQFSACADNIIDASPTSSAIPSSKAWYTRQELLLFREDVANICSIMQQSQSGSNHAAIIAENEDDDDAACSTIGLEPYLDPNRRTRRLNSTRAILKCHRKLCEVEKLLEGKKCADRHVLLAKIACHIAQPAYASARVQGFATQCCVYPEHAMESLVRWKAYSLLVRRSRQQQQQRRERAQQLRRDSAVEFQRNSPCSQDSFLTNASNFIVVPQSPTRKRISLDMDLDNDDSASMTKRQRRC